MKTVPSPSDEHARFDEICAGLAEWEPLLPATSSPTEPDLEQSDEDRTSELNGQILAGLVSP
jgi:hypothetical protein